MKKLVNHLLVTALTTSIITTITSMSYIDTKERNYINSLKIKGDISEYKKQEVLNLMPAETKEKINYAGNILLCGLTGFFISGGTLYCLEKRNKSF